jgi:predicted CoA-binding protein
MKRKAKIETLVETFLSQKSIAIVGVSDKQERGSNQTYKKFETNGYYVYAVNPTDLPITAHSTTLPRNLIPETEAVLFLLNRLKVTEQVVQQCVNLAIRQV